MSKQDELTINAPDGAVLIVIGDVPEEFDRTGAMGGSWTGKWNEGKVSYKIGVPLENGTIMVFNISDGYTLETLTGFTEGDAGAYLNDLIANGMAYSATQDAYDQVYVNSFNVVEVDASFFETELGVLDEDERAIIQSGGTVNLANQIEDFTSQVKAVNANKTLWNNGLYQDIVMEYYFKFNDPNLAVSLAKNDARFGNVLNQVGMSMEEVTATDRYNTDQNALDRDIKANVAYVDDLLEGMEGDLDAETKEWVAREYTYKRWNDRYLRSQLLLATDPYSGNEEDLDTGFALQLAKGKVTQTEDGETEIQALLDMYLPKAQHASYQDNMKMHAGKYRNDPEYAKELEEDLKDLRFTLYPQYDRNLKWSTIETGALNTINKAWGMQVDPGGTYGYVVDKIIDLNDALKAQSFLIDEGLNLNIENVVGSFAKDMMTAFGGSIARSQDYIEPTQNRRI